MPEPLIIIPGDEDQARGYRVTYWKRFKNYECIYCQYSTLWLERMVKHQEEGDHPWAYPGQYPAEEPDQLESENPEY